MNGTSESSEPSESSGTERPGQRAEAVRRLVNATNQLLRLEADVLHGDPLDEDAFDRLVDEFCDAVKAARRRPKPLKAPPASTEEPVEPLAPTHRLLFVRWLVERGRLFG